MSHSRKEQFPVVIVGAGPVGLSLALALARQGVRSVLLEKNQQTSRWSKAPGILPRTLEIFQQLGVLGSVQAQGNCLRRVNIYSAKNDTPVLAVSFDILKEETAANFICILEQAKTERLLLEAVQATGLCRIRFNSRVVDFWQKEKKVCVKVQKEDQTYELLGTYLVGCDGASSMVRKHLDLSFEGFTYRLRAMLADVRIEDARDQLPWPQVLMLSNGFAAALRLEPSIWRILRVVSQEEATRSEFSRAAVVSSVESLLGAGDCVITWKSAFRIHRRLCRYFRIGPVLLAGDAAHINSPAGGQGMNSGIQDAHNLAWKLAHALRGGEAEPLLDSYEQERRGVVQRQVNPYTDLLTRAAIMAPTAVRSAGLWLLRKIMRFQEVRRLMLRQFGMLRQKYGKSSLLPSAGGAVGQRLPNVELTSPTKEKVRLYELIGYQPALLFVGCLPVAVKAAVPLQVIQIGQGAYQEVGGLLQKYLGLERGIVLVRPDLVVAWAKEASHTEGLGRAVGEALGLRPNKVKIKSGSGPEGRSH